MSDRDTWLAERRKLIGASETPSILGCGFESPSAVWLRKIGEAPDQESTERMEIGEVMQAAIIELARRWLGFPIIDEPANVVRVHPEISYVGASLDAVVMDGAADGVPLDAKNIDQWKAKEWESSPPLGYTVQLQQQMAVTGADHGYLFALIGGNRCVYHRVERNQRFIDAMLAKLAWFWNLVQTRTPPPIQDAIEQQRVLSALHPQDNGQAIQLDEVAANIVARREAFQAAEEEAAARVIECSNELRALLGDCTYGALPDNRWVSWKTQTSKGCYVEPKTFRVLRIHNKRPKDAPAIACEPDPSLLLSFDDDPPSFADYTDRFAAVESALLSAGAISRHVSPSGSRYFVLPGGLNVRVADHDPNQKTQAWLEQQRAASVRVDCADWEEKLSSIVGPQTTELRDDQN